MVRLLLALGQLIAGFMSISGPLVLLMYFLKLRDRRESDLFAMVLHELNFPDLRGLYALNIRCSLLPWGDTVSLDMWNCSNGQIWDIMVRLSRILPSSVRLVVQGIQDQDSKSAISLKVKKSPGCMLSPAGSR